MTSIKVQFDPYTNGHVDNASREYTYKTELPHLRKGDFVIVEAGNQYKVAIVTAVCERGSFLKKNAPYPYKWAFQRVDIGAEAAMKNKEKLSTNDPEDWA